MYQKYFQDPKSADILNVTRTEDELEVDFTIANALGGRRRHQITCVLNRDGGVDKSLTGVHAALWALERDTR